MPLRHRRPLAWFALCAFLCGWMLPFLEAHPLGLQDDAACQVLATPDDSATPQLDAAKDSNSAPTHCIVCHLMRAMSGAVSSDATTLPVPFVAGQACGLPTDNAIATALAAPSSRGPPATL